MKYLLDTHVLLWIANDDSQLSKKTKNIFLNEKNDIFLSTASIWEMAIKISLRKLNVNEPLKNFIKTKVIGNKIKIINISVEHLFVLESLPFHHRDPFDRLIIAQSIIEKIPVLSKDTMFKKYDINLIWK